MHGLKWILIGMLTTFVFVATACDNSKTDGPEAEATAAELVAQEQAGDEGEAEAEAEPAAARGEGAEVTTAVVGERAPNFTLKDETGKSYSLSDFAGKIVVLEWFNIPCPFVRRHYAANTFATTIEAAGGKDEVVWLAIDSTHNNTPADSAKWKIETANDRKADYPILQDPSGAVGRLYEAKTTPQMYVIDAEGVLRYNGAIDDDPRGNKDEPHNYVIDALKQVKAGEDVATSTTKPYGCTVKYSDS